MRSPLSCYAIGSLSYARKFCCSMFKNKECKQPTVAGELVRCLQTGKYGVTLMFYFATQLMGGGAQEWSPCCRSVPRCAQYNLSLLTKQLNKFMLCCQDTVHCWKTMAINNCWLSHECECINEPNYFVPFGPELYSSWKLPL